MTSTRPTPPRTDLTTTFFHDLFEHTMLDSDITHVERTEHYTLGSCFAPSPDLNLICARSFGTDAPTVARHLAERLATFDVPFLCALTPDAVRDGVGTALEDAGVPRITSMPIMTLPLTNLREEDTHVPGLHVRRVRTDADLDGWLRVSSDAFAFTPDMTAVCRAAMRDAALDANSRAHFSLGVLNGEPVGSALTVLGREEAGVWCIGTATSARRRGVGAAMTTFPLFAARDAGYSTARLGATPAGFPVYTRLGWQVEYDAPFHLHQPGGTHAGTH